ncbi:O-antigen chain length regulator [Yersinia enterocolitica]|uniref:Wzz/FepE/Etk N-terminal domain-containing protein n=1 Tax=Yersinia enterocolitica TaxID=630 RepID=UPI00155A3888|nr:Wzz/FepE/Etk N-terminal domain-containing protein [Yersinia enterocolitica]MBX9482632.1 O-antigen chain length regulator [Yersinia enterocolitica]NQS94626.1 O-antigen chain length regulator [Yersinia enterocolitica]NQT44836.1 O-antigen chain length regulator [Yersinia enterocolitica]NQT99325.1 O-antigen chain length regulator [Yersinia enterocolitica]HDL6874729.1 O-antigen chain length regulator [Yersinia enterocolitica]
MRFIENDGDSSERVLHNQMSSSKSRDVDIFEFFFILINSWKILLLITLFSITLGFGFISFKSKQWISTAVVSSPSDGKLQTLISFSSLLSTLNIELNITSEDLLTEFMRTYSSQSVWNSYLSGIKAPKVGSVDIRVQTSNSSSRDFYNNESEYVLIYTSGIDNDMANILNGYINYVNEQVSKNVQRKVLFIIDTARKTASQEYQLALQLAKNEQQIMIQRLAYAVSIAKAANLQYPVIDKNSISTNEGNYLFLLGYDALNRQLEINKSVTDLTTIDLNLLNKRFFLNKVNELQPVIFHVNAFDYLELPSKPVQQDTKKNLLTVVLFGLIGFASAIGFVLVRHYVRERQNALLNLPKE